MEVIDLKYTEDLAQAYSDKRKTVTKEDAEDLIRVFIKYLKLKIESGKYYAIKTPIGVFYKDYDSKLLAMTDEPKTKEEITNENNYLNYILKGKIVRDYNHDQTELIQKNTNNHPIKT